MSEIHQIKVKTKYILLNTYNQMIMLVVEKRKQGGYWNFWGATVIIFSHSRVSIRLSVRIKPTSPKTVGEKTEDYKKNL